MTVHLRSDQTKETCRSRLDSDYSGNEIFACDFYVPDIEHDGIEIIGGYQWGRIKNIDHHAPGRRMERRISSTNLAIDYMNEYGKPPVNASIVLNHTDCDSVLTAAILSEDLEPEAVFGEAAIAADHSGAENCIADLLQALRTFRDYDLSLRNLNLLSSGKQVESIGLEALKERNKRREAAQQSVEKFRVVGNVAYCECSGDVDAELFLPLLPDAVAILLAMPCKKGGNPHDMKLWLGNAAPEGLSLHELRISEFDPGFGGRWNAGSNRKNGGTQIGLEDYALEVARRLKQLSSLT